MADEIHVRDLLLRTIVGLNEEERTKRQDVLINLTLYADLTAAGLSDAIDDAVNYRTITKRIIAMVESSRFYLVEKMAEEIAEICLADPRVQAARVSVEKPGALRFARSVGVEIQRSQADLARRPGRAYLSLGSNIEPERNLREAVRMLRERCTLLAASPVYETAPVGTLDQPTFLNAAVWVETGLTAEQLKTDVLAPIEAALGRVRTSDKNAARTIDLDIALFNLVVLEIGSRHIPDPDILKYAHVAVPLAELAPYRIHPETGQTLEEIAAKMPREGIRRRDDIVL